MYSPYHRIVDRFGRPRQFLVIRERDCGLFSTVLQVLNTLLVIETHGLRRLPLVLLGQASVYFDPFGHEGRRNVWEYYFEPLIPDCSESLVLGLLGERAFALLESKRRQCEYARGYAEFPERVHTLRPLAECDWMNIAELDALMSPLDWAWSEAYYPTVDGQTLNWARPPVDRAAMASLVRRYVRPRQHVRGHAERLFNDALRGHPLIGVHVRGTDHDLAPWCGGDAAIEQYFAQIEDRLGAMGRRSSRIFLATDEQYVVERFAERFGDTVVYREQIRSVNGDERFGQGPTGQPVPGYVASSALARLNGEDAVVDYLLLSQCEVLVHNNSSLALVAAALVPDSISV